MERFCAAVGENFDEWKIKNIPATVKTLYKQFPLKTYGRTPVELYCCCPLGHTWKYDVDNDVDNGVPDFCTYCNMWYANYGASSPSEREESRCNYKLKSRGRVIRMFPVADLQFQLRVSACLMDGKKF